MKELAMLTNQADKIVRLLAPTLNRLEEHLQPKRLTEKMRQHVPQYMLTKGEQTKEYCDRTMQAFKTVQGGGGRLVSDEDLQPHVCLEKLAEHEKTVANLVLMIKFAEDNVAAGH